MNSEESRTGESDDGAMDEAVDETTGGDAATVDESASESAAETGSPDEAPAGQAESDTDAESATEPDQGESKRNELLPRRLVFGALALSIAALVTAAIFGVQWWAAASDDNVDLAQTREDVVRVGSSAVKAFTELDYRNPDQFFDRSVAVSTKEYGEQVNAGREANKKTMVDAKTIATTNILDIAVEELNNHEGKTRFLAAIQVEVKQGENSSVKPMRLEVQMTRVDSNGEQAWKVSGIDPVPVVKPGN